MSLLEDLRRQAEDIRSGAVAIEAVREENVAQVEAAMARSFRYLKEVLLQLKVIRPANPNPTRFQLPRVAVFEGLVLEETFIDYRKSRTADIEYYESVMLQLRWTGATQVRVERDMPVAIQRTRDALWHTNIRFEEEETRREDGTLEKVAFKIPSSVVTDVRLVAVPAHGTVRIYARNMERLGLEEFLVPAREVNEPLLEQFASALLGRRARIGQWRTAPAIAPSADAPSTSPDARSAEKPSAGART